MPTIKIFENELARSETMNIYAKVAEVKHRDLDLISIFVICHFPTFSIEGKKLNFTAK